MVVERTLIHPSSSSLAFLAINAPTSVHAQYPGSFGGFGFGGFGGGTNNNGGGDDDDGDGSGFGFGNNGFFNISNAQRRRGIHGILAAVAFVILFPVGAIALKVLPGRAAFVIHVLAQMVAWVMYIAAAALGFSLVRDIRFGGQEEGWLVRNNIPLPPFPPESILLKGQQAGLKGGVHGGG